MLQFPVSGVETFAWLPPLVAALISSVTSVGGLSGAFLLLPFQMSVLGFTGPAVSGTNLLFNVVAIPLGVARFVREGRMVWPLVAAIALGTLPGVLAGVFIRVHLLPDPATFKLFVAAVLAYVGLRLLTQALGREPGAKGPRGSFRVDAARFDLRSVRFRFEDAEHRVPTLSLTLLSLAVGIVGGTYGIGGGAIIAPFLVTVYRLPVHTVAGASLFATFLTSVVGVAFYAWVGHAMPESGLAVSPDWALGLLFGLGGAAGIYLGARLQRYIPARAIKLLLVVCIAVVVAKYIAESLG